MTGLHYRHSFVLFLCTFLLAACSTSVYREVYPTLIDGTYDTEFPYKGCSAQLEEISESVKMISSIAYYRTYPFAPGERITRRDITDDLLRSKADSSVFSNRSSSGTATVVYVADRRVALLTCAHVVSYADTILSYHIGPDRRASPFLKGVGIKERQLNFVGVLPEGGECEVLVVDKAADVAIVGKKFQLEPGLRIRVFNYPHGKAKELEWGSFVYLFGYPSGYRMVTKGIVSNPNKDRQGSFLVDGVFGGGFSGGIALAIRDGVPNFELVGIVKLVSAQTSYVLTPPREVGDIEYDPTLAYTGDIFVERRTEIEYGVTQAISIETIQDVVREHRESLERQGYYLTKFIRPL